MITNLIKCWWKKSSDAVTQKRKRSKACMNIMNILGERATRQTQKNMAGQCRK